MLMLLRPLRSVERTNAGSTSMHQQHVLTMICTSEIGTQTIGADTDMTGHRTGVHGFEALSFCSVCLCSYSS